jgi:hypothetical protein
MTVKISQLTALTGADATGADLIPVVDVSPSATTKKMTRTEFFRNVPQIRVEATVPEMFLIETDGSAGFNGTSIFRNSDAFSIRTTNGTTFVSTDYLIQSDASGANLHAWRIANSEVMRITSAGNVGIGKTSPGSTLDVNGQISGKFTNVGTNTAAQDLATNHVSQVTISADTTLTTTVPPAGTMATVIIVTSGATSRTVTFGTGFASTGTLATGTTASRRFVVSFVSDGTRLLETGRTTAITV